MNYRYTFNNGNFSAISQRQLRRRKDASVSVQSILQLKKGIWIFFYLLIFEGALRKWVLPGLATPLLIIRDPIAIWLIFSSWKQGLFSFNSYVFFIVLIGIVGIYTAVFFGHGSLLVAVYGARVMFFYFPLIFVIGRVFNHDDVIKLGKATLWISIPMTILIALQFYSPQSAWVNRGVGGDVNGAGFAAIMDYFRPPGTFSFTNGTSLFYGLVAPFVFYFWIYPKNINLILLIAATACLLTALPLSLSRGLFFQFCVSLLFTVVAISRKPKYLGKMLFAIAGGILVMFILGKTSFFQTATGAFQARFEMANDQEGGLKGTLGTRYMGGLTEPIIQSLNEPFFGSGLGMGTNVGSMLLVNRQTFLVAEGEWGRIIGELGPIMGLTLIFIRLSLSMKMTIACYKKLANDDILPWLLLSFALVTFPQIQWAQPTSLGFCILIAGLVLASLAENQHVKQGQQKKPIRVKR